MDRRIDEGMVHVSSPLECLIDILIGSVHKALAGEPQLKRHLINPRSFHITVAVLKVMDTTLATLCCVGSVIVLIFFPDQW